ncbi:MAG: hypothetical protein KME46_23645 [Brasilonema angustatum HA4187-MV1]|nr:hypothetical protein [Brasilonema angustatum HA4187-MV1]
MSVRHIRQMFVIWHFDSILLLTGQEQSNVLLAKTIYTQLFGVFLLLLADS